MLVGLGEQHLCCQAGKRNNVGSKVIAFVKETLRQEKSILLTGRISLPSVMFGKKRQDESELCFVCYLLI